jgi:NADH-quinone oxidoreductase subunit L
VANKYYVDQLYDDTIVEPIMVVSRNVLWRGIDGMIDGVVNLSAAIWRWIGSAGSALQNGEVGTYAWALVAGVVVVLGAVALRS